MPGLVVKPRSRIFHGHEWVYASEILKSFGNPQPGEVISLKDGRDRLLGSAIYNPASQIVARRFSRRRQSLDRQFFLRRLDQAAALRERLPVDPRLCRLVWSESDGLPGVVVDRYLDHLVLQTLTLAMDQRRDLLVEALRERFQPASIVLRNDSPIRKAEGLGPELAMLDGPDPGPFVVDHHGLKFEVHPLSGQKTGLYLDQLDAYERIARLAAGRRVLDCFCNQGGFGLACARAGAAAVTCVDISPDAVMAVHANARLNQLDLPAVEANAFDFLKSCEDRFDLVILDPPSFTRSKKNLRDALRGYKEIHLRALKLLEPGGVLATWSCSHHVSRECFLDSVRDAAVDARRTLRLIESLSQRADHPILPTIPETEYLKGFAFELLPGR